jgi:4-hydroxybenzoate polyprenyltransferase
MSKTGAWILVFLFFILGSLSGFTASPLQGSIALGVTVLLFIYNF